MVGFACREVEMEERSRMLAAKAVGNPEDQWRPLAGTPGVVPGNPARGDLPAWPSVLSPAWCEVVRTAETWGYEVADGALRSLLIPGILLMLLSSFPSFRAVFCLFVLQPAIVIPLSTLLQQ